MEETNNKGLLNDGRFDFLFMKQVPIKTKEQFVSLASEEFGGHFGFCLKALMDNTVALSNDLDSNRVLELEKRIIAIEGLLGQKKEETPVRKTLGGRELVRG